MSDLVSRLRNLTCDRYNTFEEAADELERKDVAITELLAALKSAETLVREWGDTDWLRAVIAKYDTEAA